MSNLINERAENWLRTLEGAGTKQYEQDQGGLHHTANLFCVLGVAANLVAEPDSLDLEDRRYRYDGNSERLTDKLAAMYGFISGESRKEGQRALVYMNDIQCLTFPEIAAHVRANPELFFVANDKGE